MSTSRISRLNDELLELQKKVEILEKVNQSVTLDFDKILIDGEDGVITVFDASDNEILQLNQDGMSFFQQNATGDIFTFYYDTGLNLVAYNFFGSYSGNTTEFAVGSVDSELNATRLIYQTFEIDDADLNRLVFMQYNYSIAAGVFSSAAWVFGLQGVSHTLGIQITNTSGGGYLNLPKLASDPSGAAGDFYYNTSTGKLKVKEGGTWKTVTTS